MPPLPMPRRSTLSATEREQLLALPENPEEFIRQMGAILIRYPDVNTR